MLNIILIIIKIVLFIPYIILSMCCKCNINKWHWNFKIMHIQIHHKGCYGIIKLFSKTKHLSPINGITMSTYFGHHEKAIKRSIIRSDRIMLHKLTTKTLFCPHCYQPFLMIKYYTSRTGFICFSFFVFFLYFTCIIVLFQCYISLF